MADAPDDDANRMKEWLSTFGHPELADPLAKSGFMLPRSLAALDDSLLSELATEVLEGEVARKQLQVRMAHD